MTVLDFPVPFQEGDRNPFDADTVNAYRKAKWKTLVPLPYGKQAKAPVGYTGRNAKKPDQDTYKKWIRESRTGVKIQLGLIEGSKTAGPSNIAIVHGYLTIAIDVDDYEYIDKKTQEKKWKTGGKSLKQLESELGQLPTTWVSSARGAPDQSPSGQRFFRLRPEHATNVLRYNDKPADSIEIVRAGHRYSVVWPSMNGRLGEQYVWWRRIRLEGRSVWRIQAGPPNINDLPFLPDRWVEHLTSGFTPYQETRKTEAGVFSRGDMLKWIDERAFNGSWDSEDEDGEVTGGEFEPAPCRAMQSALDKALDELTEGSGGAHDIMARKLWHGLGLAHEGHSGIKIFLSAFHDAFIDEVQGRRDGGKVEADEEWNRALIGAFEAATAREDPIATSCPCFKFDAEALKGIETDKDPASLTQNDDGNAELLVDLAGGKFKFVSGWDDWLVWDDNLGHWKQNAEQDVLVMARKVGILHQDRAAALLDYAIDNGLEAEERDKTEKKAKKLYNWGILSGNLSRIRNMIALARSYDGISATTHTFNADPRLLTCKNGTIEMAPRRTDSLEMADPVTLRDSVIEDMNTYTTGIDYIPWSEIRAGGEGEALMRSKKIVEDYLDTFIPDRNLRWFVQRVFGYGLYGANPERKIVFLHGPTSTGKSTILSAVSAAVGGYAGPFNLSLLRDKQDEGPRAELVNALHRRMITATEGGQEWHLHADMIKRVTGGSDEIAARKLFSNNMIESVPNFTPFIASNNAPTIDGADMATYRRLLVLPFKVQVGLDDDDAADVMQKAGMDAFMKNDVGCKMVWLSWMLEGYAGYVREGIQDMHPAVLKETELFKQGLNDLNVFLYQTIISDERSLGHSIPFRRLCQVYEAWCFDQRIKEKDRLSSIAFGRKLRANGLEIVKRWAKVGDLDYDAKKRAKNNYIEHARFVTAEDGIIDHMDVSDFDKKFNDQVTKLMADRAMKRQYKTPKKPPEMEG